MAKPEITPALLREILQLNPETGQLFWKDRGQHLFDASSPSELRRVTAQWNSRCAGKEAFCQIDLKGYRYGAIFARTLRAHRVIWAIHHGKWPDAEIDHINGIPSDNRIINLRVVTPSGNARNRRRRADNRSGVNGVHWHKRLQRWTTSIKRDGRHVHLGYYASVEEAAKARAEAEVGTDYHPNHGRW